MKRYAHFLKNNCLALLLMFLFTTSASFAAEPAQQIIAWDRLSDNPIAHRILQMALDNTQQEYGTYELQTSAPMEQGRLTLELEKNLRVHVASFAPTAEREKRLLPIRIPVTKGLLGFRVCLIPQGSQTKFDGITNREQWIARGLTIGQGTHWPDTAILEANGLPVVKSVKYAPLFDMLIHQRFDCFSRSVSEVLPELEQHAQRGLELEQGLMLVYRLPTYFFVSRDNPELAQRIEKGMRMALANGTFDALINKVYDPQLKQINFQQRRQIFLDNPLLSQETHETFNDLKLWRQQENTDTTGNL